MSDQIQTQNEPLELSRQARGLVWAESGTNPDLLVVQTAL